MPLLATSPAAADDWPQYRGPGRDGLAPGSAAAAWSPQVVWRRPIGDGFSAIAVVDGALYTLETAADREHVVCFAAATGEERWRRDLGPAFENPFGSGPRSTPAVADGAVYALGSYGSLAALRATDGVVLWQVELPAAVGGKMPRFGYSPSPLLEGELLLLEVGAGDGRAIAAFDRATGEVRWSAHSGRLGYSSPIALDGPGGRQIVFVTATSVVGLSTTGEVRWVWPIPRGSTIDQPIATPVADGDGRVFVAHRGEGGSALLQLESSDDVVTPRAVWENRFFLNHMSSSVYLSGHLYGFHNATLKCIDAETGRERWEKRGLGKGSLIASGDRLLVLSDDGQLVGVGATPEAYREIGRLQVLPGRSWTAPAAAGDSLYLRDHEEMVRVDLVSAKADQTPREIESSSPDVDPGSPSKADGESAVPREAEPGELARVLAAHLEARGGAERLRQVERLRLRGRYAENSVYSDFLLLRQSPDHYRFELKHGEGTEINVHAGSQHWRIHPTESPEPGPLAGDEVFNLRAEAEIHGPLVDAADKGHSIELIGLSEIDGGEAWELQLIRRSGGLETWFLDRDSYLPVERRSKLNAYGEAWKLRTYHSDYRAVEGLMLPHLIESEFSSVHRLLRVEEVEINPDFAPGIFLQPADLSDQKAILSPHFDSSDRLHRP